MKAIRRRDALIALSAAAALPFAGQSPAAQSQSLDRNFSPPGTPMRFSRSLIRELTGGAQIIVSRAWAVHFAPVNRGFALRGEQIEVEVKVPPGLEGLAELERRKVEAGMFPLMLSQGGIIMNDKAADPKPAIDLAIAQAGRKIAERGLSADDETTVAEFLRTLQSSAQMATNKLPRDLFSPRDSNRSDTRTLPLPGGGVGEVIIGFTADTAMPDGLLSTAERVVTTRIGETTKTSTEQWALTAI